MPRTRDEELVERARALAAGGRTQAEVSAALGVPRRTLRSWGIEWPANKTGRPRLPDGEGSRVTRWRRGREAAGGAPEADGEVPASP